MRGKATTFCIPSPLSCGNRMEYFFFDGGRWYFEDECKCKYYFSNILSWRSQRPRGLRRRFAVARPLRLPVRNPPGAWMSVCRECCVLSGRGLCDGLITLPEESYRLWCVVVCNLESSWMRRPWPTLGRSAPPPKKIKFMLTAVRLFLV